MLHLEDYQGTHAEDKTHGGRNAYIQALEEMGNRLQTCSAWGI